MTDKIAPYYTLQEDIYVLATKLKQIAWASDQKSLESSIDAFKGAKETFQNYKKQYGDVDKQIREDLLKPLKKLGQRIKFCEQLIHFLKSNSGKVDPRVAKVIDKLKNKRLFISFEKLRTYAFHLNTLSARSPNQETQTQLALAQELLQQTQSLRLDSEPEIQTCTMGDKNLAKYYSGLGSLSDALDAGRKLISIEYLKDTIKQDAADLFSLTHPQDWLDHLIKNGHRKSSKKLMNSQKILNLDSIRLSPHEPLSCLDANPTPLSYVKNALKQTTDHLANFHEYQYKENIDKMGLWICIDECHHFTMVVHKSGKACLLNQYSDDERRPYPYHVLFSNLSQAGEFLHLLFGEIACSLPDPDACQIVWFAFKANWKEKHHIEVIEDTLNFPLAEKQVSLYANDSKSREYSEEPST